MFTFSEFDSLWTADFVANKQDMVEKALKKVFYYMF